MLSCGKIPCLVEYVLQREESIQDPGEVCSENEAKHFMPGLAEQEILQGEVQKGHWESGCAAEAPGTWHSLSFVPFA